MPLRRADYLHEAGHAVVAHEKGLIIEEVKCLPAGNHCKATLTPTVDAALAACLKNYKDGMLQGTALYDRLVGIQFGWFCMLLGGIAGESLVSTSPIESVRRAADDLPTFFAAAARITSISFTDSRSTPDVWSNLLQQALDHTQQIIARRRSDVETVATHLEKSGRLSGDEVRELLLHDKGHYHR